MVFDSTYRRLLSGARNGSIKVLKMNYSSILKCDLHLMRKSAKQRLFKTNHWKKKLGPVVQN